MRPVESFFQPKQADELLSFNIKMETIYDDMKIKCEVFNYGDFFAQYFDNINEKYHIFIDHVVDYMESFFSLSFQPCLHCEKHIHFQFPLYFPISIFLVHSQVVLLF